MKRIIIVLAALAVVVGVTMIHFHKIMEMSHQTEALISKIYEEYDRENWEEIDRLMDELHNVWYSNRLWASVTLRSSQIDDIEISLEQCTEYSKIRAKENFIGEFKMFCLMTEHLPKQEGISLGELL